MVYFETTLFYLCLALIFFRPFISQMAFGQLDLYLTALFSITAIPIIAINKNKIKHNHVDSFILLFVLSLMISLMPSLNPSNSLSRIYLTLGNLIVFYLIRCLDKKCQEKILRAIVFSAAVLCFYGIYQYFWGFRHILESLTKNKVDYPFAYEWLSRKRVFALFFSPNAFAGFLIMALPIVYGTKKSLEDTRPSSKPVLIILGLLSVNLLITQSISAIFSLVLAIFIILLIKRPKKSRLYIIALSCLVVILIVFYLRNKAGRSYIAPLFSIEQRIGYYKEAFALIRQRPWLGMGLGNFVGDNSLFVHNSYLQVWIELGILGSISYLGIVIATLYSAIKKIKQENQKNNYAIPLFCAFLAFSIHNLLDFTFFLPEVSWLWWIIIALIIS